MGQLRQQFAKRLKTLREQRGMTQEDLAKVSGLSTSFVRSVEQAVHAPSFESLEAIARVMHIEVKELFDFHN